MTTASSAIAKAVGRMARQDLTAGQRHLAYRAVFDTIAVAVAARSDPAVQIARRYIDGASRSPSARLWTDGALMPLEEAAWLNGIASHVLDYDDVMAPMRGHLSVAVIPALMALASGSGADGRQFAIAYAASFEIVARLSRVMVSDHYGMGWHSTSALGVIGAAVGGAVLLKLGEEEIVNAIGLAVAQAAGTRQNFGTMAKSFQIGECNRAAVRSVLLAQAGLDASGKALDGPSGYLALYAKGNDVSGIFDDVGTRVPELEQTGLEVKKYPCCYASHLTLDAILSLRQEYGLDLGSVAHVEVVASHRALEALSSETPTNGLEAKFSLAYATAAALRDGTVRLSSFEGERAMTQDLMDFLPKVSSREEGSGVQPRFAHVAIQLTDGSRLERRADSLRGGAKDPLSDEELIDKAADCLSFGGLKCSAAAFAEHVFSMDNMPVDHVIQALN